MILFECGISTSVVALTFHMSDSSLYHFSTRLSQAGPRDWSHIAVKLSWCHCGGPKSFLAPQRVITSLGGGALHCLACLGKFSTLGSAGGAERVEQRSEVGVVVMWQSAASSFSCLIASAASWSDGAKFKESDEVPDDMEGDSATICADRSGGASMSDNPKACINWDKSPPSEPVFQDELDSVP